MLAFGAAAMLARMYPRGRWLWYAVAAGCGLTRVLARAHFVSDIALAAVVGWAVTALIWRATRETQVDARLETAGTGSIQATLTPS